MAQFKSSAREGNYSNRQLVDPNAVQKIQQQGADKVRAMQNAQSFLEQNQRIALQAQQQAQGIENKNRSTASSIKVENLNQQKNYTEEAYKREVLKKQNKDKFKVDTLGALVDFSKTAFDITSKIVKQNKEIQQKAINQIAVKYNLSHKDLVNAKSLDNGITNAQFQESQLVKKLVKEGKSQEYINMMYDHLVKGGGYRNYIENSIVVENTGRQHASKLAELRDTLLRQGIEPDEISRQVVALDAKQRATVEIDGRTASAKILEKYNSHTRREVDRTDQLINQRKAKLLGEMADADFNSSVVARFQESGITGAYALAETSSSPGVMTDIVDSVLATNPNAAQLEEMLTAKYTKNGKVYDLSAHPELVGKVRRAQAASRQETLQEIALEKQVQQAETDVAMAKKFEELKVDGFTEVEHQELIAFGDNLNATRDRGNDSVFKNATISAIMRPRIKERLDEMVENGTLTESYMNEMQIPADMEGQYRDIAKRLGGMRATSEYKGARAYFGTRFKGVIRQVQPTLMIDGAMQSDQVEWLVNAKENKALKAYQAAVMAGVENPLQVVGDKFANQITEELNRPGFVEDFMIVDYQKTMRESHPGALKAQKMITLLSKKTAAQKSNPNTWVEIVGTQRLQQATKELAETGSSEVLRMLGSMSHPPLSVYEVQEKIAEVNPNIEPIEVPTFMEMYKELPAEIRNTLNSNLASKEKKLEALRASQRQFALDTAPLPIRSTFNTTYTHNGSAGDQLIDIIIGGEGGYDSVNRGTAGDTPGGHPGLREKTLGEVMALQSSGQVFAVGAAQFIPETLKVAMRDAGLSSTDKFSPRNQRAMAMALMIGTKQPALAAYLNGTSDDLNAAHQAIANEWASIQGPSGRGSYDGDSAGNYAGTSGDAVKQLLIAARYEISGK